MRRRPVQNQVAAFQKSMQHRVTWKNHALDLGVTVGVALCPEHGERLPELLRRAEQAMFDAKRQRSAVGLYSPSIEAARLSHLSLLYELQVAIEQQHLVPFLQPKLCLTSGRIVGAEALVRWRHPMRGWLPPSEFIPFAERTGCITSITRHMLEQCVALLGRALSGLKIAVNISTYDLRDDDFAPRLAALLARHGVAPERLQIEITESGLLGGEDDPVARLAAVRALGVELAIDDFGTGQSSLAYLQRLPAHELKIDRSFVHGACSDPRRRGLLASITSLGHSLGLIVTAEGAETQAEIEMLREAGCDLVQGYAVARPMPVDEFLRRYDVDAVDVVNPRAPA